MASSPSIGKEGKIRWFWILKSNKMIFLIVILWETAKDFISQQWEMEYRLEVCEESAKLRQECHENMVLDGPFEWSFVTLDIMTVLSSLGRHTGGFESH